MFTPAHVTSVDAVRDFHAALGQYRAEVLDGLTALNLAVRRAFDWLADQRKHWDRAVREGEDAVALAKSELARKQFVHPGDRKPDTTYEEQELRRALQSLKLAEEKAELTRRWQPSLQRAVEEFEGPIRQLTNRMEIDMPRSVALVQRMVAGLEAYLAQAAAAKPAGLTP